MWSVDALWPLLPAILFFEENLKEDGKATLRF